MTDCPALQDTPLPKAEGETDATPPPAPTLTHSNRNPLLHIITFQAPLLKVYNLSSGMHPPHMSDMTRDMTVTRPGVNVNRRAAVGCAVAAH